MAQAGYRQRHGRFGSMHELLGDATLRGLLKDHHTINVPLATQHEWWAWRRSESGWVFAIGSTGEQPLGWRYYDAQEPPDRGPGGPGWCSSDKGNWSGDWS